MTTREENSHRGRRFKIGNPIWIAACILALLLVAAHPVPSQAAQVTLQWDAVQNQGVARYRVFARLSGNSFDYASPAWDEDAHSNTSDNMASCTLAGLEDDTLYYFVVRAVDSSGFESGDSNEVSYHTPGATDQNGNGSTNGNAGSSESQDDSQSSPEDGSAQSDESDAGTGSQDDSDSQDDTQEQDSSDDFQQAPEVDTDVPEDTETDAVPPEEPSTVTPANNSVDVSPEAELVSSDFEDVNGDDTHTHTRWLVYRGVDDTCVFDKTSDVQLTRILLPPLVLNGDTTYYWTAIHYNQSGAASQPAQSSYFSTAQWAADSGNPNGVPDSYEVLDETDLDNNGLADSTQGDIKCFTSIYQDQFIGIKVTTNDLEQLLAAQPIDPSTISTPVGSQPYTPYGLVNFKIELAPNTDSAFVTVYFSGEIDKNSTWLIYDPVWGYATYDEDSAVSPDGKVVTLYLEDGAPGDMDGAKNGVIVTIAGYAGERSSDSDMDMGSSLISDDAFVSGWEWEPEYSCFIETMD